MTSGLDRYFALEGKAALVTGSTRGIGLAIAQALSAAGARVMVSSEDADDVAATVERLGGPARGCACDVRDPRALDALLEAAEREVGPLDVLVCNAGVQGPHGPSAQASPEDIDAAFAINLRHPMHLAGAAAERMAARGGGSIVLTASLAGLRGNKAIGVYALTKAALIQLARNLAVEWGPSGVRANALAPGLIHTDWTRTLLADDAASERRLGLTPLRRAGQTWEVAAAALFLAGPGAGFVTGQTLVVDGGTLITDGN